LVRIGYGGGVITLIFLGTMRTDVNTVLLTVLMLVYGIALSFGGTVASTVSQSAVEPTDLGVGNGVNLFIRTMSASLSVAMAGAFFDSRLGRELDERVPAETLATLGDPRSLVQTPKDVRALEPTVSRAVIESIASGVRWAFLLMIPAAAIGFVTAMVIRTHPLRDRAPGEVLVDV
jgi:hypothetical protein